MTSRTSGSKDIPCRFDGCKVGSDAGLQDSHTSSDVPFLSEVSQRAFHLKNLMRSPSGSNAVATDLPYEHPVVVGIFINLFPILKSKVFV